MLGYLSSVSHGLLLGYLSSVSHDLLLGDLLSESHCLFLGDLSVSHDPRILVVIVTCDVATLLVSNVLGVVAWLLPVINFTYFTARLLHTRFTCSVVSCYIFLCYPVSYDDWVRRHSLVGYQESLSHFRC